MKIGLLTELPRITEVLADDELRPMLNYAYISKEYIFATDAHTMIRLNTREFFDESFIKKIPPEGFFFDRYTCYALHQPNIMQVDIVDITVYYPFKKVIKALSIHYLYGKNLFFPIHNHRLIGLITKNETPENKNDWFNKPFPENSGKRIEIDQIGMNAKFAFKLQKAMGETRGMEFNFYGKSQAIICKPLDSELNANGRIGLLMPMMITKKFNKK